MDSLSASDGDSSRLQPPRKPTADEEIHTLGTYMIQASDAAGDTGIYSATFRILKPLAPSTRAELGLSDQINALCIVDEDYSTWGKHHDLRAYAVSLRVDRPVEQEQIKVYNLPDGELYLLVLRQRVRRIGSVAFGQIDWTQGELGVCSIHGFNPETQRLNDLGPVWNALKAIGHIKIRSGGAKAMSDEAAFEEAVGLGIEWLADNPGKHPKDFGRPQLAAKRCTGLPAVNKWMRDKHFGIRRVQREIARRVQWPT